MPYRRPGAVSGFTLIELLVVIAIIGLLASILFPVFVQARRAAYNTICLSNLRQWGMCFHMYADDYEGFLPTPGGAVDAAEVAWIKSATTGLDSDQIGALWPYVKTKIKPDEKGNLWSCPLAGSIRDCPGVENGWSPGCTYSMNDYLRAAYTGEFPWNPPATPGYCCGIDLAKPKDPSSVILLLELVQSGCGDVTRLASPYWQDDATDNSGVHRQFKSRFSYPYVPQNYHNGRCNFLMLDGHVQAMDPNQTITQACRDGVQDDISNFSGGRATIRWKSAYPGFGPRDYWNPRTSTVKYP